MAALATLFRKSEGGGQETRRAAAPQVNPYRLRALPNEDLFFHQKKIDNSRLVRQADPKQSGECWSAIGAVSAIVIVFITTLAPSVGGVMAGYRIQELRLEQEKLENERRSLEVEEARLMSPERLEQIARQRNMVSPAPGQVMNLVDAAAGTVAANVRKDKK